MSRGVVKSQVDGAYIPIKQLHQLRDYRMYLIKNGKRHEINFGEVTWRDNISTLGMELTFDFPRNVDDRHYWYRDIVELGDKIIFVNKKNELFRGIVTGIDYDRYNKKVTAHDYAFYLNESEVIIQFNKIRASTAIQRLCKANNVPIGRIDNMNVNITEIYKGQTVSDIIKDILNKQKEHNGGEYMMEMRGGKLYVFKVGKEKLVPTFEPPARVKGVDRKATLADITRKDTISGMKTKVVVITEEKERVQRLATEVDSANLRKYGLFQKVVNINKDEVKRAKTIAKNTLNEHKGVQSTISVKMLGDDKIRSGRVIHIENSTYDMKGDYLITDCTQYLRNNNRYMDLEVRRR